MFSYYFSLAVRSLKRNPVITALMVAAIALGIGATMTVFTVFHVMSGDPIPSKSSRLFVPQIDNWGPKSHRDGDNEPADQLTYTDATALMRAHQGVRQAAMYAAGFSLTPENKDIKPFFVEARATYGDFFPMFETPFLFGQGWSSTEDEAKAAVVVLSKKTNDKLFAGINSVGKSINLDGRDYRVIGVLDTWEPAPRFYDVTGKTFGDTEEVFIPFTHAIDQQIGSHGNNSCNDDPKAGWENYLVSECVWIQFWIELPSAADAARYSAWLDNYAREQQRLGRFTWQPNNRVRDVQAWMVAEKVVPNDAKVSVLLAFSFLLVCLINTIGLMLAKFLGRSGEIGLRRALGANKAALFAQCIVESGVVGLAGGLIGVALTALGLVGIRGIFPEDIAHLAHLNVALILLTVALAVVATVLAGLYPTFRAMQVQPAWQLKSN
ncbi:FtsX-like permease family protein [Pseudolysobacter antarcticus]|uniref:FtsX-like permease family protein n=1 Tax=Pseudolysobacter antarcticus TaxID=2511995 RepID=A0A411HN38_9GAMM|nr:ABC transporter permease [Pseudolysobacter antarcticus]QBB71884.1 FtsX-like permease family protein [Pseudolysobacter antarcticus]